MNIDGKAIVEALANGDAEGAKELIKKSMSESSSELVAAGTQYILQTAIDVYTDGTDGTGLNESDEEEDEDNAEEDGDDGDSDDGDADADDGDDDADEGDDGEDK